MALLTIVELMRIGIVLYAHSRFIINLPQEERSSFERLFFHIELAHWYYQDVMCEESPSLPKMSFRAFTQRSTLCLFGAIVGPS